MGIQARLHEGTSEMEVEGFGGGGLPDEDPDSSVRGCCCHRPGTRMFFFRVLSCLSPLRASLSLFSFAAGTDRPGGAAGGRTEKVWMG